MLFPLPQLLVPLFTLFYVTVQKVVCMRAHVHRQGYTKHSVLYLATFTRCVSEVFRGQLMWVCGTLYTGQFRGRGVLTVFQILSPVRSYSPAFLYQNALASVGIQAFGEHISRTLSG